MTSSTAAIIPDQNSAEQAWWFLGTLAVEHRFATETDSVVLELTLPLGASPPLHFHRNSDDSWYLLDGVIAVRCGDHTRVARTGDWVSMPRGVPHTFRVVGARPARILQVQDNPDFLGFVKAVGAIAVGLELPPPNHGPDPEAVALAMEHHDLVVVGDPMSEEEAQSVLRS